MNVKTCEYINMSFSHLKSPNLAFKISFSHIQHMLLLKLFLFKIKRRVNESFHKQKCA